MTDEKIIEVNNRRAAKAKRLSRAAGQLERKQSFSTAVLGTCRGRGCSD